MKEKIMKTVSAAMCAALALSACSSGKNEDVFTGDTPERLPYQSNLDAISPEAYSDVEGLELEPGTYISVVGKEEGSAYWQQIRAGVEQAGKDLNEALGYTGEDRIKVLFNAPAEGEDIDEQVNILDEEMARYPDVIAVSSIDADASEVQFDLATENGIPIVAFDSGNSYQGIQSTCRTDNTAAAAEAAARLCEAVGDSGEVVLIVHDSVSQNSSEREKGFKQEIEENHPQVSVVETIYMDKLDEVKRAAAAEELDVSLEEVEEQAAKEAETAAEEKASGEKDESESEEDREGRQKLEEVTAAAEVMTDEDAIQYKLSKHPEIKGCFATSEPATKLSVSSLKQMEKLDAVTVMGFDAGRDQMASLESGDVDGLVVQNPFGMGYAAVIASARTVLEIGNEADVDTGYVWVTQENREDEGIKEMLYE